ncbi:DUF4230 domain-containing protein [Arcticibacterium luteifluviistationis]|uniref:DUF4230 domain-containing protein n=1 Tax=Arcticibacterium luteifluviistationis TaxID=1784714 RepID=A0A2Z4GAQ3_9BACT|nr:DUF4230 domain-containing protein [Arcticibacterium luteifluviistationis]AWV98158.1 DUF4230 domain-containing protein [Arcticibacterium luteifluviistationis]
MESLLFILALAIGAIAAWQIFVWRFNVTKRKKKELLETESTILLERIEKVFKVILAEGYFSEIYDHSHKKDFWGLFETHKKALIVAKAKVSIGFDFSKMTWRLEEGKKKIIIENFPKAEVLSIDPQYKFYDINQGLMSRFKPEDYTKIIGEAKDLMKEKALESDLPSSANKQISVIIKQLANSMDWELDIHEEKPAKSKSIKETIKGYLKVS